MCHTLLKTPTRDKRNPNYVIIYSRHKLPKHIQAPSVDLAIFVVMKVSLSNGFCDHKIEKMKLATSKINVMFDL